MRMTVDEVKLRSTTDAAVWASEFMAEFGDRKEDIDWGLMIGWFANAMEAAVLHVPIDRMIYQLRRIRGQVLQRTETLDAVIQVLEEYLDA